MKSIFTKTAVLLCGFVLLISSVSNADGFKSVFSKDGSDVVAVGISGNYFRSFDGGNNWVYFALAPVTLNSIYAVGSNMWTAGEAGTLYRTNNNGASWTSSFISAYTLNSVFFIDANTGWIVGNNGTILKTVNGGVSWSSQTSPVPSNLNCVKFTSASNGVACGFNGKVIYTNNGGTTWTAYTTNTTAELLSVDQKSTTILASSVDGFVIKSVNSGTSWTTIDYKIDTKSNINSIYMFDANTFYSCGGGGFICKSVDAGNTFTYQQNPMMGDLVSIYFYNANSGWAVSSKNNAILKTNNGGAVWDLPPGTSVSFSWTLKQSTSGNIGNGMSLYPPNKNEIFIMAGSTLYKSYDRGETWTNIGTCSIGGSCHSFFISPLDSNIMICSKGSSGGYVCRSTNHGVTWNSVVGPLTLTSYGMPLELDQNNPNVLYLAPDGAKFYKSTDFGATWNSNWGGPDASYNGGVFRSPCDIAVVYGNSNVIYIGDGVTGSGIGTMLKSTNNGVNWTVIHNNPSGGSEIPMIAISSHDQNLAYHTTWGSGGFWKSTDMGSSYLQITSTGNMWAADIAKDDPTAVIYGSYGSTVYISTNSGTSFISSSNPSSPGAGICYYDKGNFLLQQGGGVYKLSISYTVPFTTAISQISSQVPKSFSLIQNYPNPFNPETDIKFNVSKESMINITVYDITGKQIEILVTQHLNPGTYEMHWNASKYSSGIYFYTMTSDGQKIDTKKMSLIK